MDFFSNYPLFQYSHFDQGQLSPDIGVPYHGNTEVWRRHAMMHHGGRTTESKPRLAKDEVDKLETEFQRNHKPNSSLKKQLAEEMRVDIARINNWFQNRRAKAKQEKRTQENEARRKSEQANDVPDQDAVKEYYPDDDHHDDLRPSAAPFPAPEAPAPMKGNDESTAHEDEDIRGDSPEPTELPNQAQAHSEFDAADVAYLTSDPACDFSMASPPPIDTQNPEPLSLTIPSPFTTNSKMQEDSSAGSFAPFPDLSSAISMDTFNSFSSEYPSENSGLSKMGSDRGRRDSFSNRFSHLSPDSAHSPMSTSSSLYFKSPPVDIAARRNTKRPAQLNAGCMRSYSYNHPGMKTGVDMSRRMEVPSPMRRVASATGNMPRGIHKSSGTTPRSPMYFDRNQESLLLRMASRTPVGPGPYSSAAAPPTPSTPILLNQHSRELTESVSSSEDNKRYTFQPGLAVNLFGADPTIKTPPDTPGMINGFSGPVFPGNQLQTTFEYNIPDEPLVTPGLSSFDTDFSPMTVGLPTYVSQNGASQPSTPSFPVSNSMGPAFFPAFAGGNAEYNWADASTKSSPGHFSRARQFQFTNMTAQDFSFGERRPSAF